MSIGVKIGDRVIGGGAKVYIAFEIGATITSAQSAMTLLDIAADAGAEAIKVQILNADRLVGDPAITVTYTIASGEIIEEPMRDILRRRALSNAEWHAFGEAARKRGLDVIATVDFLESIDIAVERAGANALKVASGDVNNLAWIREVAAVGLPVMLDTGHAGMNEIIEAAFGAHALGGVVLHHVPGGYPARLASVNLRVISTLRHMFPGIPIGFSDHSPGATMDIAAVALGADMIEKTLTLDRRQRSEAADFVRTIREVEQGLGAPLRVVSEQEHNAKRKARRSAYLREDALVGDLMIPPRIEWRRPGGGIEPPEIVNRPCFSRFGLPAGHRLNWGDVEIVR